MEITYLFADYGLRYLRCLRPTCTASVSSGDHSADKSVMGRLGGYNGDVPRLRRVSPRDPGWTRRRAGKGFVYLDESGSRLPRRRDPALQAPGHPAGVGAGVDLPGTQRTSAGSRHRRRRSAAVPLPRAVAAASVID